MTSRSKLMVKLAIEDVENFQLPKEEQSTNELEENHCVAVQAFDKYDSMQEPFHHIQFCVTSDYDQSLHRTSSELHDKLDNHQINTVVSDVLPVSTEIANTICRNVETNGTERKCHNKPTSHDTEEYPEVGDTPDDPSWVPDQDTEDSCDTLSSNEQDNIVKDLPREKFNRTKEKDINSTPEESSNNVQIQDSATEIEEAQNAESCGRSLFSEADKSRKRARWSKQNQESWSYAVNKKKRNECLPYYNKKGELKDAKCPQSVQCLQCRYKCSTRFSQEERETICKMYWGLTSYERKMDFILSNVEACEPKTRRPRKGIESNKRNCAKSYYFHKDGSKVRVCQSFFMKTLNINNGPINTAFKNIIPQIYHSWYNSLPDCKKIDRAPEPGMLDSASEGDD